MTRAQAYAGSTRRLEPLERLRNLVPRGRTLPPEVSQRRHRALLLLLWAHALGLTAFALERGYGLVHSAGEGLLLAAIAGLATLARGRKKLASGLVSFGLMTSSALLVHLWGGVIEAHFHFFVVLILLTLYEDWLPFLLAAAYVVIHHGTVGTLDPSSVYNHPDAVAHPWRWAAVHGLFITAAGAGGVLAWRLNEEVRVGARKAYRRARESEELFKGAFENAPVGMALLGIGSEQMGRFLRVNRAMCEITGYSQERLVGKSFAEMTHPDEAEVTAASLQRLLAGEVADYETETRYLRADGQVLWGLVDVSLVQTSSGEPLYAIAQIQDITEQKQAREQLAFQAHHDSLTGLPNRRKLMEDLECHLAVATPEEPMLLMLLDLDGFKAYNDSFGHPAGDALLSRLGRRLATALAGRGQAYRVGGDEFCVLGPLGGSGTGSLAVAAATALFDYGEGFEITASYGSVVLPVEAEDSSEALRKADKRMYDQKGRGRAAAGRQAADALLKALSERSADLGDHLSDVTDLCTAVARALGVPEDQMDPLLQAAALHDVGKIAIPDSILNKPEALDEAEWEFMCTHTQIGERILAAAPHFRGLHRWYAPATSDSTGRAIRTGSPVSRYRSSLASRPSATLTTP
ncbi:MAG: diguanylate cyclase [Actinomycetota bacterium]|nr:diguanylate cyclase [Actinomycetota bacterium]